MTEFFERLWGVLSFTPNEPLLFNTGLFLVLFTLFIPLYHLVKNRPVLKMSLVVIFSLYFYYKNCGWCVAILCGVCISDWLLGMLLASLNEDKWRRAVVGLNVAVNVGMLIYFKYFTLLANAFGSIVGSHFDPLQVLLPAGISFFTFRSISYMVDIYRGEMEPCRNLLQYAFFITFFPPLLAGPVVRAKDMIPQIQANTNPTPQMTAQGLFLIMMGLIKKVVIADYISGNFVDRIFENPLLYSGFENLMGCLGFTIQIYCDFSGYSDMAIGLALMLGYRFKDNFAAPFKSQSPTEFWARWHISLSTWLRDYVYIPLGGNRKGQHRRNLNLMTTMLLGGLWHGASWMYLLWGGYNGLLLVLHKQIKKKWTVPEFLRNRPERVLANIAITFVLMSFGFVIFRADSLQTLGEILTQIFTNFHLDVAGQFVDGYLMIVCALAAGYIMHAAPRTWTTGASQYYQGMPIAIQAVLLAVILFIVIQTRQSELVPFIYLQY